MIAASVVVGGVGTFGCSLVIDVEPDCQDAVCVPFRCTPDGVACGASCGSDADCAAGYSCDVTQGVCEFSGCAAVGEADGVALALPSQIREFAVTMAATQNQSSQFLVAVGNRSVFGYRRFQASNGAAVGDQVDPTHSMIVQVGSNPDVRNFSPALASWPGAGATRQDRFLFGFVNVTETPQFPVAGEFIIDPATPPSANRVGSGAGRNTQLSGVSIAAGTSEVGFAWIEELSAEFRLTFARLTPAGLLGPDSEPLVVSRSGERPARTSLVRVDDGWLLAYEGISSGQRQITLAALAPNGTVRSRNDLLAGRLISYPVEALAMARTGEGVVLAWAAGAEGDRVVERLWLGNATIARLFEGDEVSLQSAPVDPLLQNPQRVAVAGAAGEYAILTRGVRSGRDGVWLYRFRDGGSPLFAPVRVAPRPIAGLAGLRITPAESGYAVFWLEDEAGQRQSVHYTRYFCQGF